MERARGVVRRPAARSSAYAYRPSSREIGNRSAPRRRPRRAGIRVVERVERPLERAAERLEETELVEPAIARRRQTAELGQDPLARRLADARRGRPQQLLRPLVHAQPELVLEPHRPQEAKRIVAEDAVRHGTKYARLEIRAPAVRVRARRRPPTGARSR